LDLGEEREKEHRRGKMCNNEGMKQRRWILLDLLILAVGVMVYFFMSG
jgi:ribosomal silencing factor RsfS